MFRPSWRSIIGNLAGVALLASVGVASGTPLEFPLSSSLYAIYTDLEFPSSSPPAALYGYIVQSVVGLSNLASGYSHITAPAAFAALPAGESYLSGGDLVPCLETTATTASCFVSPATEAVEQASFGVPEPNAIAILVTALSALAFLIGRRRKRRPS